MRKPVIIRLTSLSRRKKYNGCSSYGGNAGYLIKNRLCRREHQSFTTRTAEESRKMVEC
ncbi:MAG: hypothetical protein PWP70_1767 [Moorella sp. (in: firmicutes)]|nr:hypothetical protein [Moorella sp. (in: firmicutes)]